MYSVKLILKQKVTTCLFTGSHNHLTNLYDLQFYGEHK